MPDGNGSIISDFQFTSYKIDFLELKTRNLLDVVEQSVFPNKWGISIALRRPSYYVGRESYLCGLEISLAYPMPETEEEDTNALVKIKGGIAGIFKGTGGRLAETLELQLAKIHAPYILLPYLRGAMSSLLASAGVGTVIIPLINLHEVAKQVMIETEMEVIEG